jgi:uncharacterized protein YndB with AHSA1/START domain
MSAGDKARVTVFVAVTPSVAFDVFTREIDLWWKRGPKFRHSGKRAGVLHIEPAQGGRVFESVAVGGQTQAIEIGRVEAWEPPTRLLFSWRNMTFAPHESTQVEVQFEASGRGTQVTVEHRGWSALPPDHPARHGLQGAAFSRTIGMWWGELMSALRDEIERRHESE